MDIIAQRFLRASHTYQEAAIAQKRSAELTAEILLELGFQGGRIVDVGCATGMSIEAILNKGLPSNTEVFLNDLYPVSCDSLSSKFPNVHFHLWPGDAQQIQWPEFDAMISGWAMQWMQMPELFLRNAARFAKPGAYFSFAIGIEGTCQEVSAITGISLPWKSIDTWRAMMPGKLLSEKILETVLHFEHPRDVLRHLRATGATGVHSNFHWTREKLRRFEEDYRARFETDGNVTLTYRALHLGGTFL